ncbi:hypothetical protein OJJOAM_004106 [Cupriavidus sp. H18C1]
MRYELTDLRLFQAIAESQSLSGGAAAIHITASAASYRLKNLELALGTPLFVRAARGMELTAAGTALLGHVRELLRGLERMHGELGRFSAGLKGNIRLIANSSSLNGFILPSVSRFLNAHPEVNIDLEERASREIAAAIAAGEADVGVLAGEVETQGVRWLPYAVDELILAVPADHPLTREAQAQPGGVRFGAALEHDFVCPGRDTSNVVFLRDTAHRLGRTPNVRLHAPTFDAVLALVEAGVGLALVPRSARRGLAARRPRGRGTSRRGVGAPPAESGAAGGGQAARLRRGLCRVPAGRSACGRDARRAAMTGHGRTVELPRTVA